MTTGSYSARTKSADRRVARLRRHRRVRSRVMGTPERPRLAVFRSTRHIYCQLIDDTEGRTLVAASTMETALRSGAASGKVDPARSVGTLVAERAKAQGVTTVAFDRGGYAYHGRIAALADGAREGGLLF